MNELGPILAATDFSEHARHAVDRAARVAHETGAALTLMHVLPIGALQELRRWLDPDHGVEQRLHDDVQKQLHELVAQVQSSVAVAARAVDCNGNAIDEIVREANELDAGLLVLGARGAGVWRRLVLGSTSERVLRRTTRPLLVVRQAPQGPYRRVLVAVDFSSWSEHAIALARRVAPKATLVLFNAYQVPFVEKLHYAGVDGATIERYRQQARADANRSVRDLADANGLDAGEWQPCIVEGDAARRIIEYEQHEHCDLVVLGKHGRSATEYLLLGSVSKHVLAEGGTDVLVSTARAT